MAALLCLAAAHVVMQILNGICNFIPMMYTQKAHGVFSAALFQKINRLTPIQWEDTRVLDDINKALKGEQESIYFTNTILMLLTFYLPYFLFMALYLWRCKPLLVISLLLVFLPTLLTQLLRTKLFAKAEDASAPGSAASSNMPKAVLPAASSSKRPVRWGPLVIFVISFRALPLY